MLLSAKSQTLCEKKYNFCLLSVFVHTELGTCEASRFDSNLTSRFDSKVTDRLENFESPRLPRLPSYHKQHSLFNDKFQSFLHCYWDLY